MSWFLVCEACGILASKPGIEPSPPALEGEILTAGPPEKSPSVLFVFFKSKFLSLFLDALGIRCCARALSSCGERGLLFVVVCRLFFVVASFVADHGL